MYSTTKKKKDFFYTVILLLTLLVVIVGVTIAAFYFLKQQEEGGSNVYTGTLTIAYLSGEIIDVNLLTPSYDPNYDTTNNVYRNNFRVKNTGTLDSVVSVKVDVNKNEFSDDTIMYKLFNKDKEELSSGFISGTGEVEIAKNMILESEQIVDYTLVIWLKETGVNQNEEMRRSLTGKIRVDANQKID
ncbi:MAG: hypothetical protein IKF19_00855 [Bacilli bacterium]|nr:hypothetical protein [Bacilli bacterium]